ncbi:MAG: acyltransferase [Betaproteobacteria bacterium]|nr:acyltransferase [Betaproteobacteria bacterium]
MIEKDKTARVSHLADIEDSTRGSVIKLGPYVVIDSFVKIKPAGGPGNIEIGAHTVINSGCVLYVGNGISIGAGVSIASNCTLAPTNHAFASRDIPIQKQGFQPSRGGIVIEDDVWIGANCAILDGALLRRGCVVGAGSIVRGEIPAYAICAGNPPKILGYRE